MSELFDAREEIQAQGITVDNEQAMRLELGGDPVYSHIATLATATALRDIELGVNDKRPDELVIIRRNASVFDRFRKPASLAVSAEIEVRQGVKLASEIKRATDYTPESNDTYKIFPKRVDVAFLNSEEIKTKKNLYLESSAICLIRTSEVYNAPALRVGVLATHAARYASTKLGIDIIREAHDHKAFNPIIALIEHVFDKEEEIKDLWGDTKTITSQITTITTDPDKHFAFHEELGVPPATIIVARQNYEVLRAIMDLPYALQSNSAE